MFGRKTKKIIEQQGEPTWKVELKRRSLPDQLKYWQCEWQKQYAEIARLKSLLEEIDAVLIAVLEQDCFDIMRFPGLKAELNCLREQIAARAKEEG